MSDAGLRELERRWRASGDPADEARVLAERLRLGALARARLELAAYVGHVPARDALGGVVPAGRLPLARWVALLDDDGRVALVRTVLADVLARLGVRAAPLPPTLTAACLALQTWIDCPSAEHARAVRDVRPPMRAWEVTEDPAEEARRRLEHATRTLCAAATACGSSRIGDPLLALVLGVDDRDALLELVLADTLHVGLDGAEDQLASACPLAGWALGPEHAASPRSLRLSDDASRRYLADRVQRGEVTPDRLALAAYAGDADARAVLGPSAPDITTDLGAWVSGLSRWDAELPARAIARLAARCGRRSLRSFVDVVAATSDERVRRLEAQTTPHEAERALLRWADTPSGPHRDQLGAAVRRLGECLDQLPREGRTHVAAWRALVEAGAAATGQRTADEALAFVIEAVEIVDEAAADVRTAVAGWALA